MARKRVIAPEMWASQALGACSRDARLLFVGLVSWADDEGYGDAALPLLRSRIFPYDDVTTDQVAGWLRELVDADPEDPLVWCYTAGNKAFYRLPKFLVHNRPQYPTPSRIPKCPDEQVPLPHRLLPDLAADRRKSVGTSA